jgi:hypothetical protein
VADELRKVLARCEVKRAQTVTEALADLLGPYLCGVLIYAGC